jgi:hypothetical protein
VHGTRSAVGHDTGGAGDQASVLHTQPGSVERPGQREEDKMLWTIFVILLAMWLLGMVTSYTMGGFIHILLVLAVAAALIRIIQGRRPV